MTPEAEARRTAVIFAWDLNKIDAAHIPDRAIDVLYRKAIEYGLIKEQT